MTRGVKNISDCGHGSGRYEGLCRRCYDAKRYLEDPQAAIERAKKHQEEFPEMASVRKRRHHLKKYGVVDEDYDRMFLEQNGVCKICGASSSKNLHIDHDHKSGTVRGLLCQQCNMMLGCARDRVDLLEKGIEYLKVVQHESAG